MSPLSLKEVKNLTPIEPSGRYYLRLKFGEDDIFTNLSTLKELIIVQDINSFLPLFTLTLIDTTGDLTHVIPFDKRMSKVYIEIADDYQSENRNSWDFVVYRRKPISDKSQTYGFYTINGLLDINNVYAPTYSRGFNQNIITTLESISSELGVKENEIGISLNYDKNLIQPGWSNIHFLNYLADNLVGVDSEAGYKTFLKNYNQKTTFVFKNLKELVSSSIKYKFILRDIAYEDMYPVFAYSIFDNYKIHTAFSAQSQTYGYFDYNTSSFITGSYGLDDFLSLTDFFLVDKEENNESMLGVTTGRSNDFTENFAGKIKGSFYSRLMNLSKLWISTKGIPNICPGDLIFVFFPQGLAKAKLYSYQYSGYWLVQRVVHTISGGFSTKLLLTRTGVDTDVSNTLVKATKKK